MSLTLYAQVDYEVMNRRDKPLVLDGEVIGKLITIRQNGKNITMRVLRKCGVHMDKTLKSWAFVPIEKVEECEKALRDYAKRCEAKLVYCE